MRWSIEEALEALDQYGSEKTSAKVAGHGFMALKDPIIVGDEGEEGGERVVGGYEGKQFGELAGKVVDLKVVRMCFGRLCWRRRLDGGFVGETALAFVGRGGQVGWL